MRMHTKAATTPHLSVHKFRCFGGDLKCVCTGSDVSMLFCADGAPFLVVPFAPTCHKPETVFFCSSLLRVPKVLHSPSIILHVFYKVVSGYGGTSCKQSVIKYFTPTYSTQQHQRYVHLVMHTLSLQMHTVPSQTHFVVQVLSTLGFQA